jgi:eukaryotic-like serine/threonine-protein kinase
METIADFGLVKSLGEGNHGQFFLASPPSRLGVEADYVAVKVLAAPNTEDALRRTSRELRAFASARSPYLVRLLDAGQDGHRFYYAMEYFPFGSLADPVRPLLRSESLRAVTHASRAAHALHEVGLVHGGIKPTNILLDEQGAKLSDLGLVQLLAPGQKVTSMGPISTVEYMDPAVLRGAPGSRATDIWSLGVTLHRTLTGEGVYGDLPVNDPLLTITTVLATPPALSPRLSSSERDLIGSCLDPASERRPPTAEEFAVHLETLG